MSRQAADNQDEPKNAKYVPHTLRKHAARRALTEEANWNREKAHVETIRWRDTWPTTEYALNEKSTEHKQLIVLDLNGTLLYRGPHQRDRPRVVMARPKLDEFLEFATKHFAVMVWSSAQPENIMSMLKESFGDHEKKLVRVWDRRFCDLSGSYFSKAQSIKDLTRITDGFTLADSPNSNVYGTYEGHLGIFPEKQDHWKVENIILVDDSESKAAMQKDNHIFVSTYTGSWRDGELGVLTTYLHNYLCQKEKYPDLLGYVKDNSWIEFRNNVVRLNTDEINMEVSD
ncbi:hypothetical protein LPJ66_000428 [Kickxella alabastrina]|uniref:Uncharacterized protein n=1 Tax=Kickxella alabastrina TaxID=61397 RepID=A0ACC1IW20_9FUNG|nr:hypothetical protein LPJ66_000428 [Kickxella alabastrina]